MPERRPAELGYVLLSRLAGCLLLVGCLLLPAIGRTAPSRPAPGLYRPAPAAAPAPAKLPPAANSRIPPALPHATMYSPKSSSPAATSQSTAPRRRLPSPALGGPARYDAKKGAVLGVAMGHKGEL
jgi:hypothetical protein